VTSETSSGLATYPIRLVAVFCLDLRASRAGELPGKPGEVRVEVARSDRSEDSRTFSCRLKVVASYTVLDVEPAFVEVTVQGNFESDEPLSDALYEAFTAFTPVSLLWPYARAYTANLGQMLGVGLPPLPTLDTAALGNASGQSEEANP
jgi:preprotein translocase subunit SecB